MSYLDKFYNITEPIIGLDIGYSSIKIVQINRKSNPPKLMAFNIAPIPPKAMTDHKVTHDQEIADIIIKAMHEAQMRKIRGKYAVSGLPESKVFTKIIEIPLMGEEEMEHAIPHEASRHIPLPISDIYLDYQPLNLKDQKSESVLVIAAPKKLVQRYINVMNLAGLEPIALETKPIAAGRALISPGETEPGLIVDIGAEATGISVFDENTIKFTYTIPHGGYTFTKTIANALNIDNDKAEKIKCEYGITPKCKYGDFSNDLKPILGDIIEEISNAIKFYQNRSPSNRKIMSIRLCGGGGNTRGLAEYLYQNMDEKIKVYIGNPFINLNQRSVKKFPPEKILRFTTAVGLALREKY